MKRIASSILLPFLKSISILVLVLLSHSLVYAASCCGGGAAFPTLITGDFKSQASISSSYGHVVGDADTDGSVIFRNTSHLQDIQTYKLEGSYQVSELTQIGLSLPFISAYSSNSQISENASAIGDVMAVAAYEMLPVHEYSPWKPRGFAYFKLGVPTGVSPYSANSNLFTDVNGSGFYSTSLGVLFVKTKGNWDFEASAEVTASFAENFQSTAGAITAVPGPSAGGFIAAGYSPIGFSKWRVGLGLAPHVFAAKQITGAQNVEAASELYWDSSLALSYMPETEWMISASYTDQTLLGPVQNTTLSRTAGVMFQHRWNL